eukprot:5677498-Karenia_brevis.AAC.1
MQRNVPTAPHLPFMLSLHPLLKHLPAAVCGIAQYALLHPTLMHIPASVCGVAQHHNNHHKTTTKQ